MKNYRNDNRESDIRFSNNNYGYDHNYPGLNMKRQLKLRRIILGLIIVIIGSSFLLENLGIIEISTKKLLFSWQTLSIILTIVAIKFITLRHYVGAILFLIIAGTLTASHIFELSYTWSQIFWPILIIFFGFLLLFKPHKHNHKFHRGHMHKRFQDQVNYESDNGFINSDNTFGAIRQIVLDPVFKGGKIKNIFGGTVIDLRKTTLENEETYIEVDCQFGGIEIYAPSHWLIISDIECVMGGTEDKRYMSKDEIDTTKKLIIKGKLTFAGLEIKS